MTGGLDGFLLEEVVFSERGGRKGGSKNARSAEVSTYKHMEQLHTLFRGKLSSRLYQVTIRFPLCSSAALRLERAGNERACTSKGFSGAEQRRETSRKGPELSS